MGTYNFVVGTVINTLVHHIIQYLRNEHDIIIEQRYGFPMIPKTYPKVVIILEISNFKTFSHFRLRTLYCKVLPCLLFTSLNSHNLQLVLGFASNQI